MEEAEGVREKVRFGVEGDEVVEAGAIGGRGLDGVRVGRERAAVERCPPARTTK